MLKQIQGKETVEMSASDFKNLTEKFSHVVVDLGTGDGKFAYHYAKSNPEVFVIGIDAAAGPLEELSHKASRKPAKGGLDNLVFIWAAAEQLPDELNDIAHEVYVNFPWGSLLTGIATGAESVMSNIVRISHPEASLHIFLSYDTKFEPETMKDADLPELSMEYLQTKLANTYLQFGLAVMDVHMLTAEEKAQLTSSWPKKILSKRDRDVYYIHAHGIQL